MEIVKTVTQFGEVILAVSENKSFGGDQHSALYLNLVLAMVFQMKTNEIWTPMAIRKMM